MKPISASIGRSVRPLGVVGTVSLMIVVAAAVVALAGHWIAPHDPLVSDGITLQFADAPGHPLGYDANGRDVLSRLLVGARSAMIGPLVVVAASLLAGVSLALLGAWIGGRIDSILNAAFDIAFAFPGLLMAILAAAVLGSGLLAAVITLSLAFTPYIARVVRGSAIQERTMPYIAALEVQGMSGPQICVRHLLPNVKAVILAQATTLFGYAMVDLAAISFLGLGVQPPGADWGVMVFENREGLSRGNPGPSVLAGMCLIVVVVAFGILGDRLSRRSEGNA